MPRIEYRMQTCHLSQLECDKLTGKYRSTLKKKAEVCGTLPNSVVHNKDIYNLKSIWDLQIESQLSGLTNRLNDRGSAGKSTIIRLKQAQIKNWKPANLLNGDITENFEGKDNFSAILIKEANKLGLRFESDEVEQIFQWLGGSVTIESIMKDKTIYKKSVGQLRDRRLMYIDQIIDPEDSTLLSWQTIKGIGDKSNRGREPIWYNTIKDKSLNEDGSIKDEWKDEWEKMDLRSIKKEGNKKFYYEPSEDRRIKEWCCFRDISNNLQWGKIKEKDTEGNRGKWQLYHYKSRPNGQQTDLEEYAGDCEYEAEEQGENSKRPHKTHNSRAGLY